MNYLKFFFSLLGLVCISQSLGAQKVPSNCKGQEHVWNSYKEDAYRLTVRRIHRNNSCYKDSIFLPNTLTDTLLKALVAVYYAPLKASDSIRAVHTFPHPSLYHLDIAADSNLTWMKRLRLNRFPTYDTLIDSLFNRHYLYYSGYIAFRKQPYHVVYVKSDSMLNILPLTDVFKTVPGVYYSNSGNAYGDGNNITDSIFPTHIELNYSIGWGDCPAGCSYRRFWKFRVYWDCSVEFVSSEGDIMPITSLKEQENKQLIISPNPFQKELIIQGLPSKFEYTLYNNIGEVVTSGVSTGTIADLQSLAKGIYVLKIWQADKVWGQKVIKE